MAESGIHEEIDAAFLQTDPYKAQGIFEDGGDTVLAEAVRYPGIVPPGRDDGALPVHLHKTCPVSPCP